MLNFKSQIISDQKNRFKDLQVINEVKFQNITDKVNSFDVVHPCIGENFSFFKYYEKKREI